MIPITMSLGVAVSSQGDLDTGALIRAADQALCRARNNCRNRVETSWQ